MTVDKQSLPIPSGKVKRSLSGTIRSKGTFFIYDCTCDISEIISAYLVIDAQLDRFLFLKTAQKQCYISLDYDGFLSVYDWLSKKLGFDDALFQKYSRVKKPLKARLWRKIYPASYRILKASFTDSGKGFEIQSSEKEFISWDLPLAELKQAENIKIKRNSFDSQYVLFKYPLRIGNIVLNNLAAIIYRDREDVPVLHFFTECYNEDNTDQSYWELKKNLQEMEHSGATGGYERADQKHFSVNLKGMRLEITYTHDSKYGFDSGSTSLGIYNCRDYDELLINSVYESAMEVSGHVTLTEEVHIYGDYKEEKSIHRRPPKLTEVLGEKSVIWTDKINKKIGFAGKNHAVVYDTKTIEKIAIQNILPAKGAGYSELKLGLKKSRYYKTVFMADCHAFDDCAEAIEELTGKTVEFFPETMDI